MNNITIELCQEDRARLDTLNKALAILTGQLEGINAANEAKGLIETKVVEETIYEPEAAQLPGQMSLHELATETPQEAPEEVEQPDTQPEPETAQDEPQAAEEAASKQTYTVEDVRAKAKELTAAGKRAAAKAIVNEYAASITDLPADKCDEVMARLTALEKQEG
jgi:hypothetical protein